MIISTIKPLQQIHIDHLPMCQLYMHPYILDEEFLDEELSLPDEVYSYECAILKMLSSIKNKHEKVFITIDTRIVEKGASHRRPGKHVDGNYIFDWSGGGGGWLTGVEGRILSPENHMKQYCDNEVGGMLIAASVSGCKAWEGEFEGYANQGGDCSHIETNEGSVLEPNRVYFMNSTAIHESMPQEKTQKRVLIRITLPPTKIEVKE